MSSPSSLPQKRVAVIGAGPSGLTAARQAIQNGCRVCIFERLDGIGGVWKMASSSSSAEEGTNRRPMPASSTMVVSKELCAFSDFPVPDEFPHFLRPSDALAYLHLYAREFSLPNHLRLKTDVREICRSSDWDKSGKWIVRWMDMNGQKEEEEHFDGVLLCTGMRQRGWRPAKWRMEMEFKGKVLHAEEFTNAADYQDKTVCVVGMGNSAVEIAAALAPVAKQVLLSTRRGAWLLNRVCPSGQPWDWHFHTRWHSQMRKWVPKMVRSKFSQLSSNCHAMLAINPNRENGRPEHNLHSAQLTFGAEQLGCHLCSSRIRLKSDIWSLSDGNSMEFVDGTIEHSVDAIILCTGFQFDFAFVEEGTLLPVRHNDFHLYKHMFASELSPHHSLAVIGHVQPIGGCLWPIAELQSRLFFEVLFGRVPLPSPFWMKAELEKRRCAGSINYVKTRRHTQMEDHVQFCIEIAKMVGAELPPFHRLFFSDPKLALALYFGPLQSAQFRLSGPFSRQEEGRELVLKEWINRGGIIHKTHWHCVLQWIFWPILAILIGLIIAQIL